MRLLTGDKVGSGGDMHTLYLLFGAVCVFGFLFVVAMAIRSTLLESKRTDRVKEMLGPKGKLENYQILEDECSYVLHSVLLSRSVTKAKAIALINSMDDTNDSSIEATILGLERLEQAERDFLRKQEEARLAPELARVNEIVDG